ncbi:unnamed protein product (macronuclear) [Paramecium tetraurelia]|uniref:Ribosome biogenesis protein NOP53 n=1 Tax=Paramecium tetraurelia TaxID=5888 RepID=A0DZ28_PARTE|nr:uncharacterized protein GSPATT00003264001 [Paramecium tetraurelia]CAK88295.1 unnamed protein product [Paramecium tetraurelia]|eukprot:XP_001455692.1 hypothetical protein (macronuclear) [Paramecium tetraurelia strain d4-2]
MLNIKKKNLRARQGTQRWRKNIIVEMGEFENIDFTQNDAKPVDFQVDAQPVNIYENKERFKKKPIDPKNQSQQEKITIQNMAEQQKKLQQIQQQNEIQDLWSEEGNQKKVLGTEVKAVVTPHPGQSYNPQLKDYNELLDDVVKKEIRSHQRLQNEETEAEKAQKLTQREREKKKQKKMSKIQKIHGKEVVDRLIEKQKNHELLLVKKIKKELNAEAKLRQQKRKQKRKEKRLLERARKLSGRNLVPIKVGNKKVEVTQDEFVLDDQLKSHLRHVTQGDLLVKSEFDGFVRRGLIEPKSKSNKLSKAKVPLFKIKEK